MKVIALIPAAGSGKRTGSPVPKQYIRSNGKPLLAYTLEVFQSNTHVHEIAIAVHPDYTGKIARMKRRYGFSKLRYIVSGGKERQDSVFAALATLEAADEDLIVVHDAARPMLPDLLLSRAIQHAKKQGSALVAVKAKDTLLKTGESDLWEYPDRKDMYYVQTPQIFRYGQLLHAFRKAAQAGVAVTDESMLMHFAGYNISLVEGSLLNFKVTTKEDVALFKQLTNR